MNEKELNKRRLIEEISQVLQCLFIIIGAIMAILSFKSCTIEERRATVVKSCVENKLENCDKLYKEIKDE